MKNIIKLLRNSKDIFITGHIRPDGDTIASALALACWLESEDKKVEVVFLERVPQYLMFLPGADRIILRSQLKRKKFDLGIIIECLDTTRTGNVLKGIEFKHIMNIDHHRNFKKKNSKFDLIDSNASSTAELVFNIMQSARHKPTLKEAICLYVGMVTDTGKFQQANTTSKSFLVAAELVKIGVDPVYIYRNVYGKKSYGALKLLGKVLDTLTVDGNISYLKITRDMYKLTGAKEEDIEEFVNYAGLLPDVKIFCLFRELLQQENTVKVSLRSYGNIDVSKIAREFGGGGHVHAAGFQIQGEIESAIRDVISILKNFVE